MIAAPPSEMTLHRASNDRVVALHVKRAVVLRQPLIEPTRHARQVLVDDVMNVFVNDDSETPAAGGIDIERDEVAIAMAQKLPQDSSAAAVAPGLERRVGLGISKRDDARRYRAARVDGRSKLGK